jgi:hypothetical protein
MPIESSTAMRRNGLMDSKTPEFAVRPFPFLISTGRKATTIAKNPGTHRGRQAAWGLQGLRRVIFCLPVNLSLTAKSMRIFPLI